MSSPTEVPAVADPKLRRVLACVLCQQRKVKCDRKSPCANCTRTGAKCVAASLAPRQRRRRFPERELLQRLRHCEDLLRQNNVSFDPLHPPATAGDHVSPRDDGRGSDSLDDVHSGGPRAKTHVESTAVYEIQFLLPSKDG